MSLVSVSDASSNISSSKGIIVKKSYLKISHVAFASIAILSVASGAGVITSSILFFHMAVPLALMGLVISAVAFGILQGGLTYTLIYHRLPTFLQKIGDLLAAALKEFMATPLSLGLIVLQCLLGKSKEKLNQKGNPILLIHGYASCSRHFSYLKYCLKKNNCGAIYTVDLNNSFSSIDKHVKKVEAQIAKIQKSHQGKITLVGHSMGGIVASRYVANCVTTDHISQVFTIGSPLQGTYTAYIGIGKSAMQMRKNSQYLNQLEADLATKNVNFTNIGSHTDIVILPNNAARFKSIQSNQKIFKSMGHLSYLYSDKVAEFLIKKINSN